MKFYYKYFIINVNLKLKLGAIYLPSKDIPLPAIVTGRGLRPKDIGFRLTNEFVDIDVDVDKALPGLDDITWPLGVTFPDREPIFIIN